MAEQGMKNLEKHYVAKISRRVEEIRAYIWTDRVLVEDVAMAETLEHLSVKDAKKLKYKPVKDGARWGQPWGTAWFRLRFSIPKNFKGEQACLLFNPEGECIVFRDGLPVQGLDRNREDYIVLDKAKGGEKIELYIEAGSNDAFGKYQGHRAMHAPYITVFLPEMWDAWHDLRCMFEMINALPQDDTRRAKIVFQTNKAVDAFDYQNLGRASLAASAKRLKKALKPLYDCKANASAQTIAAMGHAHIDVAWLWPLRETIRKCGRTFSSVLQYMDTHPDYIFCQSQPHLYEFTKERYPSLYKRIKEKVKKGQWIPTGCMWVEADCNVTSGESLVRQSTAGIRFFRKEFGHDVACLWIPDVFGYSAALPQILKRCGIDYFLTQKISWSQFTKFPFHSFRWEGIDGTKVLTHFPPCDTYNAKVTAEQMKYAEKNYREKDRSDIQAVPFGYGDGGGGPTKNQIERIRRYSDLEGMPKIKQMTPRDFFTKLDKQGEDLPVWVGELYLEVHRGTLTTQAKNKKYNRQCELLLRDAELMGALRMVSGDKYRQEEINDAWKTVLLNQFHDIIPGSSIDLVYKDSDEQYEAVLKSVGGIYEKAVESYNADIDTSGEGKAVVAVNTLAWEREDTICAKVSGLKKGKDYVAVDSDGNESAVQVCTDGMARFIGTTPSMGHSVFHVVPGAVESNALKSGAAKLENELLRVNFDKQGRLSRIYDKAAGRDVLESGKTGNQFILFEDKPVNYDAWDIDIYYNDKPLETDGEFISMKLVEQGAVRSVMRVVKKISKSIITQDIILTAGSARIDFATSVEWGDEKDVLLKVAFPVSVKSDKARYEIQFGNIERPTHWNRPEDFGQFEVVGHKWADLSEGDYGVSLLNDCKYGYDIRDNVMRLTLLRAPKMPDPGADVCSTHTFTYSILPHEGDYIDGGVVREGYELNVAVDAGECKSTSGKVAAKLSNFEISGENVVVDTVKKAEDDGSIIVRMYEAHGCRGKNVFSTSLPVKKIIETNILEEEEKDLKVKDGKVKLEFTPFQIKTLKLVLK